MKARLAAAALSALIAGPAHAASASCSAESGAHTAALVELYTSEGCDSCPPADRWLSALPRSGFGPDRIVPLALHVDYWDYIGWKDPYAKRLFSQRQRELAAARGSRFVYTPQIVLAGREHRGWSSSARFADAVAAVNGQAARARIMLALVPSGGDGLEMEASARVPAVEERKDAALYVAVYENGLASRVTSGENRGRTLRHDFAAREWRGPIALVSGEAAFRKRVHARLVGRGGIAAFVQNRRSSDVLQALALPACRG